MIPRAIGRCPRFAKDEAPTPVHCGAGSTAPRLTPSCPGPLRQAPILEPNRIAGLLSERRPFTMGRETLVVRLPLVNVQSPG
jgi:hypothetical protein